MDTDDRTTEGPDRDQRAELDRVDRYEIRLAGRLSDRWASWFDGFDLTVDADGTSVLRGPVIDQAALHGVLARLRDVGIPLRSITSTVADGPTERPLPPITEPNTNPSGATP